MASVFTAVSAISGGRKDLKMRVRIAHIWCVNDKDRPDEITCMNLLLIDEKADKIHATVRKALVNGVKSKVEEGGAYELEHVMVGFNEGPFKITKHKYKLNMMQNTRWTKISNSSTIPFNSFDFESFDSILNSAVEDKIIDVIGHVVEKDALKETDKAGRKSRVIDMTLEDLERHRVHVSLWGNFAHKMVGFFETHDISKPVVLVLQYCKQRRYMGSMGVSNCFFGTNVIVNGSYPEVLEYMTKMGGADSSLTKSVSQMSGHGNIPLANDLLNMKRMTIEDLVDSNEACVGSVLATICEIESGVDWYFRSCTKCASMVTVVDGQLCCKRCTDCKSAVLRYKLHVIVMDETGSTTFVLFDRIVSQFIGRTVNDILQSNITGDYPAEFNQLLDKQMLFKVEVSRGNVNYKWRNYGVKKASADGDIIKQFVDKHRIKVSADAIAVDGGGQMSGKDVLLQNMESLECADSCSNADIAATPTNKSGNKRLSNNGNGDDDLEGDSSAASSTKQSKIVCVKIEQTDK